MAKNIFNVFFNYNLSISTFREKMISIYWNLKKIGLKGLCHLKRKHGKINVIPNNSERYILFDVGRLTYHLMLVV